MSFFQVQTDMTLKRADTVSPDLLFEHLFPPWLFQMLYASIVVLCQSTSVVMQRLVTQRSPHTM